MRLRGGVCIDEGVVIGGQQGVFFESGAPDILVAADLVKIKRALISVSDKTDLLVLAAALKDCGVQVRKSVVCV